MAYQTFPIPTPCGDIPVKVWVPGLPAIPFPPSFDFNFPPKIRFPFPDCSLIKRVGGVPEPAEDSVP